MLDANIIQPFNSPYSSSVVLVYKADGSKRVCIDYRKLIAITVPDHFQMPRIQDNLDSLSGSVFFTTFDLFSQIECEYPFQSLIKQLSERPILAYHDLNKPFFLVTDASQARIGAISGQVDDKR
jgi:hypothetical protein